MFPDKRWAAVVAALLVLLVSAKAQEAEGDKFPEEEAVKVEVDLVTVNVSVTDGDRRPAAGLRAAVFPAPPFCRTSAWRRFALFAYILRG